VLKYPSTLARLLGLLGIALVGVCVQGQYGIALFLAVVFGAVIWLFVHEKRTLEAQKNRIEKKLKKRNRQKTKYTKKLQRLTQQQGEIISAISHEFKNPIAAIIGYAQTVRDDAGLPPHLRQKFLDKVIRNSERISEMIDRLSLAITVENRTLQPQKEPFDMAVLIEEVADSLRQKYPNRTLQISAKPTPIEADRTMLWHVVINLIDNALKYSEEVVDIHLEKGHFSVTDRGIGIAPEKRGKITQRFFRADTRSWDNSMGVGLFIVEYLLKLHDTRLEIKTTPGEGSVFGFALQV
jgi:signal transduction histidine kinase